MSLLQINADVSLEVIRAPLLTLTLWRTGVLGFQKTSRPWGFESSQSCLSSFKIGVHVEHAVCSVMYHPNFEGAQSLIPERQGVTRLTSSRPESPRLNADHGRGAKITVSHNRQGR